MKGHEPSPLRPDAEADQQALDSEAISNLAHQLWVERGSPVGSPEEDWLQAEKILQTKSAQAA